MPMMVSVPQFFGEEWNRFTGGVAGLDPIVPGGGYPATAAGVPVPYVDRTITVPGWDQVIKLGPAPVLLPEHWANYFASERTGQPSKNDPAITYRIGQILAMKEAARTSALPGWSRSIGEIMTAIDNVQDLASTLATIGRLAIWAAPRVGLRAVPVVGWIVLAGDILNLMNFFGMVAMPLYALLCSGPREAIAAGIPAAVLKAALCREAWTMSRLNPFSRKARAARRLRSMGRLPGFSNLIEVAQVTDSFFGYGLSLGALYGSVMESFFAIANDPAHTETTLNTNLLLGSLGQPYLQKAKQMSPAEVHANRQAVGVVRSAPLLAQHNDLLPDDEHLLHMAVQVGAVSAVAEFFRGGDHEALMRELLPGPWAAPTQRPRNMEYVLRGMTDEDAGIGRWWVDGAPRVLDGERLIPLLAKPVTAGVATFLEPRRNRQDMTFYGAALNQTTDHWWSLIGGDAEALKWSFTPDVLITTTLLVEGLLVRQGEHEGKLWRFWESMRGAVDGVGDRLLERPAILAAERAAGITLMRLLPIQAPFPEAWREHFRHPPADPQIDHGPTPRNAW